jgi:hypothetical protein
MSGSGKLFKNPDPITSHGVLSEKAPLGDFLDLSVH